MVIGWTILFVWGMAWYIPAIPAFMLAIWWYEKRGQVVWPLFIGFWVVWCAYL